MELRQLRYFSAICEVGSITAASRLLRVAQPALSRRIGDLERELGYRLLTRSSNGITITEAGKSFLADVNRMVADLESARSKGAAIAAGHNLHVRLGVVGDDNAAKFDLVFSGLREFGRLYPGASVRLTTPNTLESMNRAIGDAEIDAAFAYGGAAFRDHHSLVVQKEHLLLAIPADHPLAARPELAIADLSGVNLAWHSRKAAVRLYDQLMEDFRSHGIEPQIAFELDNPHLALHIVRRGLGCAFVTSAVGLKNDLAGIVLREVEGIDFHLELQLVWSGRSEAAIRLADVYRQLLEGGQASGPPGTV